MCSFMQDLAVGSDVEGMKVKDPMRTLLPVLLHPYSTYDKIRAVLLYIFSLGGTSSYPRPVSCHFLLEKVCLPFYLYHRPSRILCLTMSK